MEIERREKAYTFVTYTAVTFSLIAILAVFVTLPMVNNYINNLNTRIANEMEFCQYNNYFNRRCKTKIYLKFDVFADNIR
uniref:Nematode cuticle collagen N-terminal domain-containing protein n=1 Tax=Parascaris equorum TaxID=6256 RepID=A0A914RPI3_PAREQ